MRSMPLLEAYSAVLGPKNSASVACVRGVAAGQTKAHHAISEAALGFVLHLPSRSPEKRQLGDNIHEHKVPLVSPQFFSGVSVNAPQYFRICSGQN